MILCRDPHLESSRSPQWFERLAFEGFSNGAESVPLTSIPPGGLVNGKTRLGLLCSVLRVWPCASEPTSWFPLAYLLFRLVAPYWKDVSNELSCVPKHPNAENQMLAHLTKRKCIRLFLIFFFTVVALGLWPLGPTRLKSLFKKCAYVTAQLSVIYLVCLPVLSICICCCLGSRSILNSELCCHLYRIETVSPASA